MIGEMGNLTVNLPGMAGNNKQGVFFVPLVEHLHHLCGRKLENNRIKSFIPTKKNTRGNEDTRIDAQNIIPDIMPVFFRKINSKKVGTAAAGVTNQAEADGKPVDQSAENTDEQGVVGDRLSGNQIG